MFKQPIKNVVTTGTIIGVLGSDLKKKSMSQ